MGKCVGGWEGGVMQFSLHGSNTFCSSSAAPCLQCSSSDKQKPAGRKQRRGQIICGAGERVDSPSLWLCYGETSQNSRQAAAQLQPSDSIRKLLCCLSTS
ncbi:hypothetical protein JOQ06_016893 [Pogonophryne albipinna]|uniref:Uncharacterized protein n=1 Tax=Pogonophryne albipinna TaxID=1090488 RepID=A0AAD6FHR9_9TELE|nr:hypothetical protein JOQ06_016893 [Pogonophryne albipinna]